MLRRLRRNRAFTLVELMIVVAIIGLLAALAIYGVRKYMTNAKTTEARNSLGAISKGAQAAFDKDQLQATVLTVETETTSAADGLCPEAAQVPTAVPAGEKYQSSAAQWDTDSGWNCLRFSMQGPQYYAYDYNLNGTQGFFALAYGDLDADTDLSTFQIGGVIDKTKGTTLTVSTKIEETKPDE